MFLIFLYLSVNFLFYFSLRFSRYRAGLLTFSGPFSDFPDPWFSLTFSLRTSLGIFSLHSAVSLFSRFLPWPFQLPQKCTCNVHGRTSMSSFRAFPNFPSLLSVLSTFFPLSLFKVCNFSVANQSLRHDRIYRKLFSDIFLLYEISSNVFPNDKLARFDYFILNNKLLLLAHIRYVYFITDQKLNFVIVQFTLDVLIDLRKLILLPNEC